MISISFFFSFASSSAVLAGRHLLALLGAFPCGNATHTRDLLDSAQQIFETGFCPLRGRKLLSDRGSCSAMLGVLPMISQDKSIEGH
jgi:hypothetical protein